MKREKAEFLESVLTLSGKKSNLFDSNTFIEIEEDKPAVSVPTSGPIVINAMNGADFVKMMIGNMSKVPPTIPTLDDLRNSYPDIYEEHIKLANNAMVIFAPEDLKSNKHCFLIFELKGVYKRIKDETIILVGDKLNVYGLSDDKDSLIWLFRQDRKEIDKMLNSMPGTEFLGSHKRKCYRFNQNEISKLVDGKIFSNGGVDIASKQRGFEDLGGGLVSLNF